MEGGGLVTCSEGQDGVDSPRAAFSYDCCHTQSERRMGKAGKMLKTNGKKMNDKLQSRNDVDAFVMSLAWQYKA